MFFPGMTFTMGGVPFRVEAGYKAGDDLRLMWQGPERWEPVPMVAMAMMYQFFVENEYRLFEHNPHWKIDPKDHFDHYLSEALSHGFHEADERFIIQPRRKRDG